MPQPLDGLKVIDLTRVLSGPYCTMLLADMGADVVKVERPGTGDDSRALGPPFLEGESTYFLSINRNKRSMVLNLKDERGMHVLRRLVERADVLVENFRPGTMEHLGLDAAAAHTINPRLIFCSISGYGQTGPAAHLPGYDLVIQGEGGIMSLTGEPGGPPCKTGASQADIIAGMVAFQGILLALIARGQLGYGQVVDVSMLDCQMALLAYHAGTYFATGISPTRRGNQHPAVAPHETYRCQDGSLTLACGNDAMWRDFCRAVERLEWAEDERFRTNAARLAHRCELNAELEPLMLQRTRGAWMEILRAHGIPCGRIQSVGEACANPQVQARGMIVELTHPTVGPMRVTGIPIKLSATPGAVSTPPPRLGEHTEAILADWLAMDRHSIRALRSAGVIS